MKNFSFSKYKKGIIKIEIKSIMPEKFINLLWKNNVNLRNINKKDITTVHFDSNLKDYSTISEIAKKTGTRIIILNRRGISFFILKTKKRQTLIIGAILFAAIIYYLSNFIWRINIETEKNISPYEIRSQLKNLGIRSGIYKDKIDVYKLEEKLVMENSDIMWVRARIEGTSLNIKLAERQGPPEVENENTPSNIVANKDGEIVRVYSKAGTAVVKNGDIVKKGDVLVKGEQGAEGKTYLVHAEADVIARTFYEEVAYVNTVIKEKKRTGNEEKEIYVNLFGKNIFIKKAKNKFKIYDKVEANKFFIKENIYYELEEKTKKLDEKEIIDAVSKELLDNIIVKLDKSVRIVDKVIDSKFEEDKYKVRVVLIVEENIAESKKLENNTESNENIKTN
ncbi:putative stage IV sporulation protein YqfD [Clostridium homopropionicum DSM 5847]|uniref:Putative stage IV sporulation protein YqfD n=1 Tax=Clostridium homopropionicum DSM 5847 TaxID=1121318 RepID=A0A0L6ZE42_9CLOT|nr:sporulation protein YqfD [Clostridium homopropionicum]KOA21235.1 putative stage IV sporulation protein YqfD [Clostridium homopropionicum DSM 5847]SFG28209.1 similar to stage IV sporulation protein [Clostridium homopropionicum]